MADFFQRAYGDRIDREGVFFCSVSDGYIIAGTALDSTYNTRGYYIFKVDKHGNIVWQKQYADAFSAYTYGLTVLGNGNIAVIGTHAGITYSALAEVLLLDSAGNFLTSQTYPPIDGWGSSGVGIVSTEDSSVAITIYTDGFVSTNYYSIYRLNQDLSTRWTEFVGFDGSLVNNHSIVKSNSGDFYSLAYYNFYSFSSQPIYDVSGIRKFSSSGLVQLDSLYQFGLQTVSISATTDGGVVIGGTRSNGGQTNMCLIKLDSNGSLSWTKEFGTVFNETTVQAIQTIDQGYALIATIPDLVLLNQNDILFVRCDSNGDSICSKKIGSTLNEIPLHLEQTNDSNFAVLGTTGSFGSDRIFFAIVDSMGNTPSTYSVIGIGRYFCSGDTLSLSLNPIPAVSSSILWSNGDTVQATNVSSTGNYFATIRDSAGYSTQTNFYSCFFASTPLVSIGADTIGICQNANLENLGSGDFTIQYQWYLNDTLIAGASAPYFTPTIIGVYKLIATNYCTSDSGMVFIDSIYSNPPQPLLVTPNIDYVCANDSLRISASIDSTTQVQWFTADDFNWFIINGATDSVYYATNEGIYFIRVTDANGCINYSDPKSVSYDNIPPLVNAAGPAAFCEGGEVELSTAPGSNFMWSTSDTTALITVNTAGLYFVSYIDQYGCPKVTDTISITILTKPVVYIGPDTTVCHDVVYVLDAGSGFNNYLWNFGTASQSISVIATIPSVDTQMVFVFVTDTNGCTNSDTAIVIFDICIGVDQLESKNNVQLFPSVVHAGEKIYIQTQTNDNTLCFFELSGKEIYRRKFSNNLEEIVGFSPGVYLYSVISPGFVGVSGKMIIQ